MGHEKAFIDDIDTGNMDNQRDEQTHIEQVLLLQEELVKAGNLESIGILAGGIAHDLNNMLTVIMGYISMVKFDIKDNMDVANKLVMAEKASLRAKNLSQQLLTFSKGGSFIKKAASIVDIIKDSVDFTLRGSNVNAEFCISDDLWPVEVDEGQMNQVFNNLIINARQAMPTGGTINISAENINIDTGKSEYDLGLQMGRYIKISIQDQGIGIPEECLHKIFEPYFTSKQKGNGLGLAITYSIIKKHDGFISVESTQGAGTTFYIYLPASKKDALKKDDLKDGIITGKGRILVMDDDASIRNITKQMLTSIGYSVCFAKDGVEAIDIYANAIKDRQPFDVVILDLTIQGGMGGKDAIKELLKIDPNVNAIITSGYSNDPAMTNFTRYGFKNVVAKPYKLEELSKILQEVIMDNRIVRN